MRFEINLSSGTMAKLEDYAIRNNIPNRTKAAVFLIESGILNKEKEGEHLQIMNALNKISIKLGERDDTV